MNVAGNASATLGGPSFSNRGSGNVAYAIEGATITDSFYGFATNRQNGGTSIFFDYGTFEDVEVVTGGSSLDQQNSGVTINVVTKRGTNTLKGSARFLYASANWQSDNTPESSSANGLQTNSTRFIREYGGELGGPLIEDRLWLWAAGARQDISLSPTTFSPGEIPVPETATLEPWSAKLNAQISSPNSLTLFYQRSDRSQYGTEVLPDRPPETRVNLLVPSDFYKIEDSYVFASDLFASVFGAYQKPRFSRSRSAGSTGTSSFTTTRITRRSSTRPGAASVAGQSPRLEILPNRARRPRAQVRLQLPHAGHRLEFGPPGSQNFGEQFTDHAKANLARGVELRFRTEYWTATLGDTVSVGDFTLSAGLRFDLQRGRNLEARSFVNVMFEDPCPTCGDGFPGLPEVLYSGADDWQIEFVDWEPRISATYAIGQNEATLLRATYARYVDQLGWLPGSSAACPARTATSMAGTISIPTT